MRTIFTRICVITLTRNYFCTSKILSLKLVINYFQTTSFLSLPRMELFGILSGMLVRLCLLSFRAAYYTLRHRYSYTDEWNCTKSLFQFMLTTSISPRQQKGKITKYLQGVCSFSAFQPPPPPPTTTTNPNVAQCCCQVLIKFPFNSYKSPLYFNTSAPALFPNRTPSTPLFGGQWSAVDMDPSSYCTSTRAGR